MKKIYLCALALTLGTLSFAQQIKDRTFTASKLQPSIDNGVKSSIGSIRANYKAPGDVIWSENFDASASLPTGWTTVDLTGNDFVWVVQPPGTLPAAAFTPSESTITSTSGGNSMLLYGDLYNTPTPNGGDVNMDSYFQTAAIPVNNVLGVSVNFQQKFRRCCAITPTPEVVLIASTDPTFATNFQEYDIIGGVPVNITSADPMNMSVNISAIAANYVGNIYLRFHIKTGISHYYWMIDDIQLTEAQTNDLSTTVGSANFSGVEYSRIPVSQIQPMNAFSNYNNIGTAAQTNSNLTVTITDGTTPTVLNTPNITIPSLAIDTIRWDSLWTPTATAGTMYAVTLDVNSEDSTDVTPENNTRSIAPFTITDGIMALDDYSTTPGSTDGGNGGNGITEYEAGNQFDCTVSAPLYAIEVVTGSGTPINTSIDVVLYSVDFTGTSPVYNQVWRSTTHQITTADINTPKKFYTTAGTPIFNMVGGATYVAAVHSYVNYEFAISGTSPSAIFRFLSSHSFISHPNIASPNASSTFSLTTTPMIRLDLKPTPVGIEEGKATINFSVYPNPSNGKFTINFRKENKTATISVKNMVGQTILNTTVNIAGKTTETISLSDYSKGVYFLTVNDETVKLILD
jgi:hypothetical protein